MLVPLRASRSEVWNFDLLSLIPECCEMSGANTLIARDTRLRPYMVHRLPCMIARKDGIL